MRNFAFIFIALLVACTPARKQENLAAFDEEYYSPEYANGFKIYTDGAQLMLETYRPDTMRVVIPQGGFKRVGCMSSTYVGLLQAAGADSAIVAVSGKRFLTNPLVKERAAEVGYEGAMDYESLLATAPDIMLIYGVEGTSALAAKLEAMGVTYIYIGDFEEQDPLGRAEWMVPLAVLVGKDARPEFADIVNKYSPCNGSAKVMLNAPYGGVWFLPGKDGYMTRLIEDAGGKLAIDPAPGYESTPIAMERAVLAVNAADFWLNPGDAKVDFKGEKWEQTRDFFESGAAHPDRVLHELQTIFRGSSPDTLRYFKKL